MSTKARKIYYNLHSGKNSKLAYFARCYLRRCMPSRLLQSRRQSLLDEVQQRADKDYILQRVDYYCRLNEAGELSAEDQVDFLRQSMPVGKQPVLHPKVYYFDSMQYARWFPPTSRWILLPGDITHVPQLPSIVKSRPLGGDNHRSVLLNLDKVRHFTFVNDRKPFTEKKDQAIFRGLIAQVRDGGLKTNRYDFMEKFFGHPMVDAGVIDKRFPEWLTEKITIAEHLDYKFVMALEGNDVASNLKWIMSSNSVAVMPPPTCETWFMEGTLIPDYHYIAIKPDYSDLESRLQYFIDHPDEAQAIIDHAHDYVAQFRNARRELLISLLVLDRYFRATASQ